MRQIINFMCVGVIFNVILAGCRDSKSVNPVETYETIPQGRQNVSSEEDVTSPHPKIHEFKTISKNIECSNCKGEKVCQTCGGKGTYYEQFFNQDIPCPGCQGHKVCLVCNGKGFITKNYVVNPDGSLTDLMDLGNPMQP